MFGTPFKAPRLGAHMSRQCFAKSITHLCNSGQTCYNTWHFGTVHAQIHQEHHAFTIQTRRQQFNPKLQFYNLKQCPPKCDNCFTHLQPRHKHAITILHFATVPIRIRPQFYTLATKARNYNDSSTLWNSSHPNSSTIRFCLQSMHEFATTDLQSGTVHIQTRR